MHTISNNSSRYRWPYIKSACPILLSVLLVACSDSDSSSSKSGGGVINPEFEQGGGLKSLVIQVDGVTYDVISQQLNQFQDFQLQPLLSGGVKGTASEQITTELPSWSSLITGTWANTHGINKSQISPNQQLAVPSIFAYLDAEQKGALLTSNAQYSSLIQEQDVVISGCENNDACITQELTAEVTKGTDLIVAQYGQPLKTVAKGLTSAEYKQSVDATLADIHKILGLVHQRERYFSEEKWLVSIVSSYGLDNFGGITGSQFEANKTGWLLINQPIAAADYAYLSGKPAGKLEQAAIVDLVPTILANFEIDLAEKYAFNGANLFAMSKLVNLTYEKSEQEKRINLKWQLLTSDKSLQTELELFRDQQHLATLTSSDSGFTDKNLADDGQSGNLIYQYLLTMNDTAIALSVPFRVLEPIVLDPNILQGIYSYHNFDENLSDSFGKASYEYWNKDNSGVSFIKTEVQKSIGGVLVNSNVYGNGGYSGLKLNFDRDISQTTFSMGFWFKTDPNCFGAGASVISNKNYYSGNNAGLAIGIFGSNNSCELRFNLGDGSSRNEIKGLYITPNKWAYILISIDRDKKIMNAYAIDPDKGRNMQSLAIDQSKLDKLGGLNGSSMTLGDDGTGKYLSGYSSNQNYYKEFYYDDLSIWNRVLTLDEVLNIYDSKQSINSLITE